MTSLNHGETNLEIRRGKVVVKGQYGNQGQQRPIDNYHENASQNRMQMQNRENERPRPINSLGSSNRQKIRSFRAKYAEGPETRHNNRQTAAGLSHTRTYEKMSLIQKTLTN